MIDRAFAKVVRDTGRTMRKPRSSGRTAVIDMGLTLETQESWLRMAGSYVDEAKIMTGTASIYDIDYLRRKLELYNDFEVSPFLGGFFLERIFSDYGFKGAERYFDEARDLGLAAIEVSGTTIPIDVPDRVSLVHLALERGLSVHGEIGSKVEGTGAQGLIAEANAYIEAGADVVIVEGAELFHAGAPNEDFCQHVKSALNLDNVYFELGGPWVTGTYSWEVLALRKFLFSYFGPNVNMANVPLETIIENETFRWGLGE